MVPGVTSARRQVCVPVVDRPQRRPVGGSAADRPATASGHGGSLHGCLASGP